MNRILALGAVLLAVGFTVHAQTYTPLYDFSNPGDPSYPGVEFGTLQQTLGGYIVTTAGDFVTADGGSAFKMSTTGDISVLQHFPGPNGKFPTGSLTVATDGNFYGTNNYGGQFNYGNIFRLSSSGKLTILHSFTGGTDGGSPESAPIESEGGDLYGTTTGGTGCRGTVYRITKSGQFKTLHCFAGQEESDHRLRSYRERNCTSTERLTEGGRTVWDRSIASIRTVTSRLCLGSTTPMELTLMPDWSKEMTGISTESLLKAEPWEGELYSK